MKKLITILTIMIVLVGAVFATDPIPGDVANGTAEILVVANVSEQHPAFQLKATGASYTRDGFDDDEFNATSDVKASSPVAGSVTLQTDALLETGKTATVTFSVMQIKRSSSTANYLINVDVTKLSRVKNANNNETGVDATQANQNFPVANATPSLSKKNVTGISYTGDGTAELHLDYDGQTVAPSAPGTPVEVASFSAVWNGVSDALAGRYEATVTLHITAEN